MGRRSVDDRGSRPRVRGDAALPTGPSGAPPAGRSLPLHLNSVALVLGKLATMGVGFVVWLVAARLFAPEAVGLASGAVSATMLCVQLALFGAGTAVISLFPQHQRRPAELLDTAVGVVTAAALLAGGLFLLLASGLFHELSIVAGSLAYALAFLAMCLIGTLGVLLDQIGTALRRGDQVLVRGALFGVATLGVLVGLPRVGVRDSLAIMLAWVAGGLVSLGLGARQLRRSPVGYRFRGRVRRSLAVRLVGVGLPNWALTLTERAPGAILPIVVTELLSPEANATWYAVWMMAWAVYVIPIQVGLGLFAEASHRPTELGRAVRQGLALSLALGAVGAAGAAIVGPRLLAALGQGYVADGTAPLRILLVAVVPVAFAQAYYAACRSRRRLSEAIVTGVVSGTAGVSAAAAVGVSHGLRGMALAWLATQAVAGAWAMWRLRTMSARRWAGSGCLPAAPAPASHAVAIGDPAGP
jgi:O-antigen/teichoic acid export membrane protein